MDIAATLRTARERAGLTQGALAARSGTSQATISAYETGAKQPSVATLSRLLAVTGSRLAVEPARHSAATPSPKQLAHAGRTLVQVLELAEALPVRHQQTLRFPPLHTLADRRA